MKTNGALRTLSNLQRTERKKKKKTNKKGVKLVN